MVESIGKRLAAAREAKGLSVDDVAHSTRMRPDKILALEADDYSSFPSASYARSFLQTYGRLLSMEIGDQLGTLGAEHQVDVASYQYLNHAPEQTSTRPQVFRSDRPPSCR